MDDAVTVRAADAALKAGPGDAVTRVLVDGRVGASAMSMGWMRFPVGGATDRHTRDVEEAIYIVRGTSTIVFDDRAETLHAGDAIFIPPGVRHRHENTGDDEMEHVFFFSPQGPESGLHGLPEAPD